MNSSNLYKILSIAIFFVVSVKQCSGLMAYGMTTQVNGIKTTYFANFLNQDYWSDDNNTYMLNSKKICAADRDYMQKGCIEGKVRDKTDRGTAHITWDSGAGSLWDVGCDSYFAYIRFDDGLQCPCYRKCGSLFHDVWQSDCNQGWCQSIKWGADKLFSCCNNNKLHLRVKVHSA